jgi:hypothetical protein
MPVNLWRRFAGFLDLTTAVAPQGRDQDINVNEQFTINFTLRNRAPARNATTPEIAFLNPELVIAMTPYASPVDAGGNILANRTVNFQAARLGPGDSTTTGPITMRANSELPGSDWWPFSADFLTNEMVAFTTVNARLDTDAYFRIRVSNTIRAEIEPT